jgi:hypothetical protein
MGDRVMEGVPPQLGNGFLSGSTHARSGGSRLPQPAPRGDGDFCRRDGELHGASRNCGRRRLRFSDIRILADIGGGHGMALAIILPRIPAMRAILFDLPLVVKAAGLFLERFGVAKRVEIRGGNFFEIIPEGADAYLLKHILHDWSDQDCIRILQRIREAAKPGAKLLVIEAVLEALNQPQFAKTSDIERLIMTRGGKERTLAEWQKLLYPAGFRLLRIIHTASSASVMEAVRD